MRLQSRKSSCGPAALANALEAIGLKRSEEELIALCKAAADGTEWKNLRKALGTMDGVRNSEISESREDVAILRLLQSLYEGRPVLVCVDAWDHYAVAGGMLGFGRSIVCVDSGDNDLVVYRTVDEFVDWWRGPEWAKKPFCGVVV